MSAPPMLFYFNRLGVKSSQKNLSNNFHKPRYIKTFIRTENVILLILPDHFGNPKDSQSGWLRISVLEQIYQFAQPSPCRWTFDHQVAKPRII